MALLTLMKGLPLTYNRDMQEDKESLFDAADTLLACLGVMAPMVESMRFRPEAMARAAEGGYMTATDLADAMVRRGFRSGRRTRRRGAPCESPSRRECPSEAERRGFEDGGLRLDFGDLAETDLEKSLRARSSAGGASVRSVRAQIRAEKKRLGI